MNDLLVLVIVVAVVANVILIVGAIVYARSRRTADEPAPAMVAPGPGGPPPGPSPEPAPTPSLDFVPEPAPPPIDRPESPVQETDVDSPSNDLPDFLDPLTGLATAVGWEQVLLLEERRLSRYGRPATVVVVELDRLDALAERLGSDIADRLIPAVAETIRRSSRAADVVARTDHAVFRVLMPETDEIRAINFVERLRETCDTWLEASAVAVRLAIGWASAGPGGDVRAAARIATERMYADRSRGRPAPGRPPTLAS